mgnify:CR=1 FL=1|jgi:dCTP deaminase
MILTGDEIKRKVQEGTIVIEDFSEERLGPNSYNLRLGPELMVYREVILDPKRENRTRKIIIPPEGLVLDAWKLYLGRTMEYTATDAYVPMLEGRSSWGRLGLFVHVSAGFGDIGFSGNWTLEIIPSRRIRIYPGMEIAQIYYHTPEGNTAMMYNGKYQGSRDVVASRIFEERERWK